MGSMCSTGISFPPRNVNAFLLRELYQAVGGECELAALILRKRRVIGGRACDIRKRLLYR